MTADWWAHQAWSIGVYPYISSPSRKPPVIIERAGLILTLQLETGRVIVVDQVTGDLLFETDLFDDEDAVVIDEEDGTVTIFDPDTKRS